MTLRYLIIIQSIIIEYFLFNIHYTNMFWETRDLTASYMTISDLHYQSQYRRSVDLPIPLRPIKPYLRPYTNFNDAPFTSCLPGTPIEISLTEMSIVLPVASIFTESLGASASYTSSLGEFYIK